jgi:hypothetical protein
MPPSDGSAAIVDVPIQLAGIRLRLTRKPDIGIFLFLTIGCAFLILPGSVGSDIWDRSAFLLLIRKNIFVLSELS